MSYIMVDVESDGPVPGKYSMISVGAILVDKTLDKTFYGKLQPISTNFLPEALAISGHSREETMTFDNPKIIMQNFADWISKMSPTKPIFISDNNGYDWMFVCWYFHYYLGHNPFGHSSQNLGSLYKGIVRNTFENFKHLRGMSHTHHPVDDAKGNAQALLAMIDEYGLKIETTAQHGLLCKWGTALLLQLFASIGNSSSVTNNIKQ